MVAGSRNVFVKKKKKHQQQKKKKTPSLYNACYGYSLLSDLKKEGVCYISLHNFCCHATIFRRKAGVVNLYLIKAVED